MLYSIVEKSNLYGMCDGSHIAGFPSKMAIIAIRKVSGALHYGLLNAGAIRLGTQSVDIEEGAVTRLVGSVRYVESDCNYYAIRWSAIPSDLEVDKAIRAMFRDGHYVIEQKPKPLTVVRRIRDIVDVAGIRTYNFGTLDSGKVYCLFSPSNDNEEVRKRLSLVDGNKVVPVNVRYGLRIDPATGVERNITFCEPSHDAPFFLMFLENYDEVEYLKTLLGSASEHEILVETFLPDSKHHIRTYPHWAKIAAIKQAIDNPFFPDDIFVEENNPVSEMAKGSKVDIIRVYASEVYDGWDGLIVRLSDQRAVELLGAAPLQVVKCKRVQKGKVFNTDCLIRGNDSSSGYYIVQDMDDTEMAILNREYQIPALPFQINKLTYLDQISVSEFENLQSYPALPDDRKQVHKAIRKRLEGEEYRLLAV